MIIEHTNTIHHKKKSLLPTVLIILGFLLLIPTTLIFIGKQNKKEPTGNYLSPLPQGEITQTTTTPSPQINTPQDITIASPQQENTASVSAENDSNATTTTVTLFAGQTQLEITNPQITPDSYIYIIPHTKTNQTISVSSKKEGSFILTTNKPFDTDISLDYLVINR